jgi:hypothetical protein
LSRAPLYKIDFDENELPYEFITVKRTGDHPIPTEFRNRIFLHTVHDGAVIPRYFLEDENGKPRVDSKKLERRYVLERDWGANLVAQKIAAAMGVPGYARCNVARVLLDFNRFPGSTPHDDGIKPLESLAINYPFTEALRHADKVKLLGEYYDVISDIVEKYILHDTLIMIAVHTYDEHNLSKTRRTHLSLLTSVLNYTRESRMPFGVFDPMYPDILGESTCSRILRDRVSLNLERNGFRVSHDHPYPLPEGSMEVRAQVWFFFNYLRGRFEEKRPDTVDDASYQLVWLMLLNTNLRLAEAEALRSYLHRFRRVKGTKVGKFQRARDAYETIQNFLDRTDVMNEFRHSLQRPSTIGLEVRKDLVCSFDDEGRPMPVTPVQDAQATLIGNTVASAITTYFKTDIQYL